jgi:hypothetical protein
MRVRSRCISVVGWMSRLPTSAIARLNCCVVGKRSFRPRLTCEMNWSAWRSNTRNWPNGRNANRGNQMSKICVLAAGRSPSKKAASAVSWGRFKYYLVMHLGECNQSTTVARDRS